MNNSTWDRIQRLLKSLYRDQENGMLAGVCAGIADQFDWNVTTLRVIAGILLLCWTMPVAALYVTAAVLLPNRGLKFRGQDESLFWRCRMHRNSSRSMGEEK